jgi:hypothetical protein
MRTPLRWLALGLLSLGLSAPPDARATTLAQLTFDERVGLAELVVRGEVEEVWTETDAQGEVWTRAQVRVDRAYKGDAAVKVIVVDQLGGEFGGVRSMVPGAARFSPGEEVVLFVDKTSSGRHMVLGMATGKWTVVLDPYTRQPIVQRFNVAPHEAYDHRFIPLPPADQRVPLTDLESTIAAALLGAGGK